VTFAKRLFFLAGVYGLIVLTPQFFLEARVGRDNPPEVTHPEYFYGFVGVAVAWQVAFLVIGTDPVRYRPIMLPSVLEKATFGFAVPILYLQGRVSGVVFGFSTVDLVLGALFLVAYFRTPRAAPGKSA
jgi:hypothetical protein